MQHQLMGQQLPSEFQTTEEMDGREGFGLEHLRCWNENLFHRTGHTSTEPKAREVGGKNRGTDGSNLSWLFS